MTDMEKAKTEALQTLDQMKIVSFLHKYDLPLPTSERQFWGWVYKEIISNKDTPKEVVKKAKAKIISVSKRGEK